MHLRGNANLPSTCDVHGTAEDLASVVTDVQASFAAAHPYRIEEWLAELSVIAPKRADDEMTETLRLRVYTERLSGYPADVVRAALLVETWRFWPSWDELAKVLERLQAPRAVMLTGINRAIADLEAEAAAIATGKIAARANDLTPEQMAARRAQADAILAECNFGTERRKRIARYRKASSDAEMDEIEARRETLNSNPTRPAEGDPALDVVRPANPAMRATIDKITLEEARQRIAAEAKSNERTTA